MKRSIKLTIATTAALATLVGSAIYAESPQDKYSLKSPSGISFADLKGPKAPRS